ncbi:unnamed protein product [marine sediment metagenome]|uniref:Uncharacterized protein n=1 Tax=marine sediment metagenome TaxID=412755 RepID=X1R9E8_9ZZZZ
MAYFIIVNPDREHPGVLYRISVIAENEDELNALLEDGSLEDGATIYRGEVYATIKETFEKRKLELIRREH